jgi:phosphoribosylcarboxyaminoimidazole (NCAIR) mutase
MGMELVPYTNPTVTGGDTTVDGWVMGTTSLPVVGGTPGSTTLALEAFTPSLIAGAPGSMQVFGISDQVTPLPIGVPVVIAVLLGEIGGGHALAQLAVANLSVMELP